MNNDSFFEYVHEVILIDDVLVRTNEELEIELFLYQMIVFKEEFHKNIRYLVSNCFWIISSFFLSLDLFQSSNFIRKIVSCHELVLAISEYLSLNDAVATFSPSVLRVLWNYHIRLPVVDPSKEFFNVMSETNNLDKIVDLHLPANHFSQTTKLMSTNTFDHVRSLHIHHLEGLRDIQTIKQYFVYLISLTLSYTKLDFQRLYPIFEVLPTLVRDFIIHCDSIACSHYCSDIIFVKLTNLNTTVENFVLHINHTSRSLINKCFQRYEKCILRTITDFIKIMSNIRNIRIVTKGSIEPLLDFIEWTTSMDMCRRVETIQIRGRNIILQDKQLHRNIQEIIDQLHETRESIRFNVQIQ